MSFFAGRGKKRAWDVWCVFPTVTQAFLSLASTPQQIPGASMAEIERFVVLLYDRTSELFQVNQARQQLFAKGTRTLENIPPTYDALHQHVKRTAFQAGHIWGQSLLRDPEVPSPGDWGWTKEGQSSSWQPLWTTLPHAQDCCYELIHCGCKKSCRGQCIYFKASLKCTALCSCAGSCYTDE